MLDTTLEIFRAGLKADPTISPLERARLLTLLRKGEPASTPGPAVQTPARILRRGEAARRLGCSPRTVDRWGNEGVLTKIRLPGHTRAVGFREAEIESLINSNIKEG